MGGPHGTSAMPQAAKPSAPRARLITYRRADGLLVTAMRPIKNPEDMTAAERRAVYGNRYAPRAHVSSGRAPRQTADSYDSYEAPPVRAKRTPPPVVRAPSYAATAPVARPVAPKPAPPKPVVVVTKPALVMPPKPVAAPAPVVVAAPKPAPVTAVNAPTFPPATAGLPAPANPKLAALQAAIASEVVVGSKLEVAEAAAKPEGGQVSLSLPQSLLATLQREAAKLGLGKAARKAEVTATLSGDGYEITPNGPQTAKLKSGEAPAFNWQIKPATGDKGPLKANVDAALTGAGMPMTFSLASIQQAVADAMPAMPVKKGFSLSGLMNKLTIPGMKDVQIPGVGVKVPSNKIVAVALALLALLILVSVVRGAANNRRRAERRRKFRTMTETAYSQPDPEPSYAMPVAAVAAGALAAHHHDEAHPVSGHDDHAHGDHGHADHGAHGHGDHGHDAGHGHGHDNPAHGDHGNDSGHGDHGHGAAHGHGEPDHGHADHGHSDHGHDDHGHDAHKEPAHAH